MKETSHITIRGYQFAEWGVASAKIRRLHPQVSKFMLSWDTQFKILTLFSI